MGVKKSSGARAERKLELVGAVSGNIAAHAPFTCSGVCRSPWNGDTQSAYVDSHQNKNADIRSKLQCLHRKL